MHTTANPALFDRDGNEWTKNSNGRYTCLEGEAPGIDLADLADVAGPLILEGVTLNPIRARMFASITDPDHRDQVLKAWAVRDHVRAITDRVRHSDIKRGDVIIDDDGYVYRVERVRRTVRGVSGMTDMELTLTGGRTFLFNVSRFDYVNRAKEGLLTRCNFEAS